MTKDNFLEHYQCSFDNWSTHFKNFIYDSIILSVPIDVVNYLKSDVMVLPQNALKPRVNEIPGNNFWSSTEDELEEPNFSEFDEQMQKAIKQLGGKVFVKLNWSAPKDASWITSTRSLCCSDVADIYLLLKSSSCISDDISILDMKSESLKPNTCCLVLKKWEEIHPGTEFRCFVLEKILVGICQRDDSSYFRYIKDSKEEIIKEISNFYHSHIKTNFNLSHFTFDVVVIPGKKFILVDIGVLNKDTECLMFSMDELERILNNYQITTGLESTLTVQGENPAHIENENCRKPEFRFIDEHTNVSKNQCKHYGIPIDVVHFCNEKKNVMDYVENEIAPNQSS